MAEKVIYFPGTPRIVAPMNAEESAEFMAPLAAAMEQSMAGNMQTYALIMVNDEGTSFAVRWQNSLEIGRIMALLAAVELTKASIINDILEEVTNGKSCG